MIDNDALFEEIEPIENQVDGSLRTKNPKSNPWQRGVVHIEKEQSIYKKTVRMILCAHGWDTPQKEVPMTLLIFHFHLGCSDRDAKYKSARIWFRFGEHIDKDTKEPEPGNKTIPTVVSWAPLDKTTDSRYAAKWGAETANEETGTKIGGEIGVNYIGKVAINAGKDKNVSFTRKHFQRGHADPIYDEDEGIYYGVEFYLEQNDLLEEGVEPDFQVAILLKREKDAATSYFDCQFAMRIEGGFAHDAEQKTKRFFRFGKPEDEPILLDANRDPQFEGEYGEALLAMVKNGDGLNNMKKLQQGRRLGVFGDLPGLRPLDTPTAGSK